MIPKHHNDLAVFDNPVYQNCFLNISGKNFPDENVSTNISHISEYITDIGDVTVHVC